MISQILQRSRVGSRR